MAGRKTKLTPELIQEASTLLQEGNYTCTVCAYLGIHESTWYKWLKEGEKANKGLKSEFFKSVKRAEAAAEIRNVNIIQKAADEDWRAAKEFLEKKFPDRWGNRSRIQADVKADLNHSGEVTERHEQHTTIDIKHRIEKYTDVIEELIEEGSFRGTNRDSN